MANERTGKGDRSRPGARAARRRTWITGLGVAVVAAAIVGYFAYRAVADLPGAKFDDQGNAHIQMVTEAHPPYNSDPPTSGPHLPYIAPWGIHTEPIPRELQVHNLEDGGVVVQYRCATPCPDLADQLAGDPRPVPRDADPHRPDRVDAARRLRRLRRSPHRAVHPGLSRDRPPPRLECGPRIE
jgi:hypothetical protein